MRTSQLALSLTLLVSAAAGCSTAADNSQGDPLRTTEPSLELTTTLPWQQTSTTIGPAPSTTRPLSGNIVARVQVHDDGILIETEFDREFCSAVINAGFAKGYTNQVVGELDGGQAVMMYFEDFRDFYQKPIGGEPYDPSEEPVDSLSLFCDSGAGYGYWEIDTG